jgi:hypothetical protein
LPKNIRLNQTSKYRWKMMVSPMLSLMRDIKQDAAQTEAVIKLAEKNRLSPQDPIWGILAELSEAKALLTKMPARVDELKNAADTEANALRAKIRQLEARPEVSRAANSSTHFLLPLISGGLVGVILSGLISYFFLIPRQISEQRVADRSTLEFLDSNEGKSFIQLVKLNRNYFPDKCQEEAKKQGVFLNLKGSRVDRVCVLLIP